MEEEGIPLLSCEFSFSQEVDERGMPISIVKSGTIDLTLASMDDEELVSWAMGSEDKNGKIVFSGIESTRAFKTLKFDFGHCVKYHERFTRDADLCGWKLLPWHYLARLHAALELRCALFGLGIK